MKRKKTILYFFVISKSVRSHLCHSTMHERRGAIKLLSCYFVPFPNFKLQSLHFTLGGHVKYVPSCRYEAYIDLVKLLVQMYEYKTSGGLFLLLLSSRRLLCRQVGLAGFILHSQVSHFLNCFSFIPPVCFSSAIRDFSYIAIFAPYQAWANALAGPCQQEGEEGEAPSHTHR